MRSRNSADLVGECRPAPQESASRRQRVKTLGRFGFAGTRSEMPGTLVLRLALLALAHSAILLSDGSPAGVR